MGVGCTVPGIVDTYPAVVQRERLGLRFAEIVEKVGRERAVNDNIDVAERPTLFLQTLGFLSREAVAFRSLVHVKMRQGWLNSTWLEGLKWLSEHNEAEVTHLYSRG